jgi:hypothetical protein
MSLLLALPIIAFALHLCLGTARNMRKARAHGGWWTVFILLVLAGGCAGHWLAMQEIQAGPGLRWTGLPLPIGFFVLEGDHWTDFIPPAPIQLTNYLADLLAPVLVAILPVHLILRRREGARVRGL